MRRGFLMLAVLVAVATAGYADDGAEPRWWVFAGGSLGTFDAGDSGFGEEFGAEIHLSRRLSLAARAQRLRATDGARWHCDADGSCARGHEVFTSVGVELKVTTSREALLSGYLVTGVRIGYYDEDHADFGPMHSLGAGFALRLHSRLRLYVEGRVSFLEGCYEVPGDVPFDVQPDVAAGLQFRL